MRDVIFSLFTLVKWRILNSNISKKRGGIDNVNKDLV
jgi:hypothetical protein